MAAESVVYVNAGNDSNGNPRRGWLIVQGAEHVGFVDEGYAGRGSFDGTRFAHLKDLAWHARQLRITPGEYRDLKKRARGED